LDVSKVCNREAQSGEAMIRNGVEAPQEEKKRQAILHRNENGIREDRKFPQIGTGLASSYNLYCRGNKATSLFCIVDLNTSLSTI